MDYIAVCQRDSNIIQAFHIVIIVARADVQFLLSYVYITGRNSEIRCAYQLSYRRKA